MALTYEPIATTVLASNTSSVAFTSISSAYTDIKLIITLVNLDNGVQTYLRFNSNSTGYSRQTLIGNGATVLSEQVLTLSSMAIAGMSASDTTRPTFAEVDIFSYAGSTHKTALIRESNDRNGAGGTVLNTGVWTNTAAITSITVGNDGPSGGMGVGTTITLYGIKAA